MRIFLGAGILPNFIIMYGQIEQACAGDKLLVFAAGNAGHPFPDIDSVFDEIWQPCSL
jgi:hypothetical protein